MTAIYRDHEQMIAALNATVAEAEAFFREADEQLREREQTTREALAHVALRHLEYVHVSEALVTGKPCPLRTGTSWQLNALAARQVRDEPMRVLARRLSYRQKNLAKLLRQLPDWSLNFLVKKGGGFRGVAEPVLDIEAHIRGRVSRLRRVSRGARRQRNGNCQRLRAHGATLE